MNWILALVSTGVLIANPDLARAADGAAIRVFVFDYAGVPPAALQEAKETASGIMERAGLEIEWAECAVRAERPTADSQCRGYTTADIQLRILNASMAKRVGTARQCLGYALTDSGVIAGVYHHRALELESEGVASLSVVLGTAMTHEIGHLLLAQPGHAPEGLMRAIWDKADLRALGRGRLNFSDAQAQRIAATIARRLEERAQGTGTPVTLADRR